MHGYFLDVFVLIEKNECSFHFFEVLVCAKSSL